MISMIYGWLPRPAGLKPHLPRIHVWEGRLLIVLVVAVAVLCIVNWGPTSSPGRVLVHTIAGISILSVFFAKVLIVRVIPRLSRGIPVLGVALFGLLVTAWVTSALYYWNGSTDGYSGTQAARTVVSIADAEGKPGAFQPAEVSVRVGDVVEWDQKSGRSHTVSGDEFDSGPGGLSTGATLKAKFDKAGDFPYVCNFHSNAMKGTVHVAP